ncbi:unnamed protein product, partial [Trichobilharzia regenti]
DDNGNNNKSNDNNNNNLITISKQLTAYLKDYFFHSGLNQNPPFWCGKHYNCTKLVYEMINPISHSTLYPINNYYLFIVQRVYNNTYGYMSYAPHFAFISPGKRENGGYHN